MMHQYLKSEKELVGYERDKYLIENNLISRKEVIRLRRDEIRSERKNTLKPDYNCAKFMKPVYALLDFILDFIPPETELEQIERLNEISRKNDDLMHRVTLNVLRKRSK